MAVRPTSDDDRYENLMHFAKAYRKSWAGKPQLLTRVAALLRFTSLTNYYYQRMEANKKALVASGYFVEITLPIADLPAKMRRVMTWLSNTAQTNDAYFEAKLDWPKDEVHLLCRKQDVDGWRKGIANAASQAPVER